jgi:hypothetical protein
MKKQKDDFVEEVKPKESNIREKLKELLVFHKQKIANSQKIIVTEQVNSAFEFIINCSGGNLVLPDFHAQAINPDSEKTFQMAPGERLNLLTRFDPKEINRNRQGLLTAAGIKGIYGLPALLFVEGLDVFIPVPLKKETIFEKGVKQKEETGQEVVRINLPENEFDERLRKEKLKEKKRNDKVEQEAGSLIPEKRKSRDDIEQEEIDKL